MGMTEKALGQAQITNAGTTTVYTVPGSTVGIVRDIHIANTTAAAVTISVWIDVDGTNATDAEAILDEYSVPAHDFWHWVGWIPMAAASTIKATAGAASSITMTVSGAEIS